MQWFWGRVQYTLFVMQACVFYGEDPEARQTGKRSLRNDMHPHPSLCAEHRPTSTPKPAVRGFCCGKREGLEERSPDTGSWGSPSETSGICPHHPHGQTSVYAHAGLKKLF